MKRPSYVLRLLAAFGIISMLMAGLATTASAQVTEEVTFPDFLTGDYNEVYFAAVGNGEDFGLGAADTSITVQNIGGEDGFIFIWIGANGDYEEALYTQLNAGASKTFTADDLGIGEGEIVPVIVAGYSTINSDDYSLDTAIAIAGVAKQAVTGASLPNTTSDDTSVSGYNAVSGREVGFQDQVYLPIAQTNCGPGGCWDTVIRVSNVGFFSNAAVTLRFFPAENASGSLDTGFQVQAAGGVNIGETWSVRLGDYVEEGWVGSVHILSDDAVVAIADRFKAGTDMWITNTAVNAAAESELQFGQPYVLYAPDVRLDFNGWNTGINVANTVDSDNTVNIQYFGNNGNAPQGQNQRLAAHGMTYFYNPSDPSEDDCDQPADQVPTCDFVGGAIVLSDAPVAVAVDGVKYFGNDANVGQAFTYSATANLFNFQAAPLVQKGTPSTGMGDTSGINFLNPNAGSTFVTVDWVNPSGFAANNFGDTIVWVPGFSTGFVYTMFQENLPNGFTGSALVSSELPIVATTANVNYAVDGDGTVVWNLYNPCGFFRQLGDCVFVAEPEPLATKTFDIRPAGADALICVFDSVTGQDGKPIAPDVECELLMVAVKGAEAPEQGEPDTFVADLEGDSVAGVTFNEGTNELTADVFLVDETADMDVNVGIFGFGEAGGNAVCPPGGGTTGDTAFLGAELIFLGSDTTDAEGDLAFSVDTTLTAAEVDLLGAIDDNVLVVYDDAGNIIACAQIEAGTLRLETPEEAMERLGTVVPPFGTDAAGLASVDLAAGCYFFVVSAPGFETFVSIEECLLPGETVANVIDLVEVIPPPPPATGFLDKTFLDSAGAPVSFLVVTAISAEGDTHLEVGPTDTEGRIFAELTAGDYQLCWEDTAGAGEGDPDPGFPVFIPGCEPITIVAGETLVLVNTLEVFAVLDVCVRDEDLDLPLPGALVEVFSTGDVVAFIGDDVTDATGHASVLVDADVLGSDFVVNASAVNYESQAATVFIFSEDGADACDPATGTGGDVDIALNPVGLGAFGTITKTVFESWYTGLPNFGATVQVVEVDPITLGCPAPGSEVVVAMGVTDDAGQTSFTVLAGDYCVQVLDVDGNVVTETAVTVAANADTPVDNFLFDPATADVFNAGAIAPPLGDVDYVYLFLATSGDAVGGGSASLPDDATAAGELCLGTFIGAFPYDGVTGVASFTVAAGAVYCVATDTSDGSFYGVEHLSIPLGDPAYPPDIDLTMFD